MKLVKICLLSLTVLINAAIYGQTADEIIGKHIEATGGKEKLIAINSVVIENSVRAMDNDSPNKITIVNGKGYRTESDINGQMLVQVYTDKGGWAINPFEGSDVAKDMPADQYKAGAGLVYAVPLLNYAARGEKAELMGQEKVGNTNAYKIKVTDKDNTSVFYFIDPSTFYVIKSIRPAQMMGQSMDLATTYSDFKKSEYGWVIPQTAEVDYGGQFSLTSKVIKVDINSTVDAAVFEMKK